MKINLINNKDITDEYILFKYNFLQKDIINAINIVKNYIIENKLLIVGGTAIDYALRLKNDKIYNEEYQIPDFDIISPNNVDHANKIGLILCNANFNNISIIPAIHNTTVRVQLLGYTVFDSTFMPNKLYNKIPKIKYKNFQIIDPLFQKINQYMSMSFLFRNNGINYNISDRLIKDYDRFSKIDNYYNFYNIINLDNVKKINLIKVKLNLPKNNIINIDLYEKNKIIDDIDNLNKINRLNNDNNLYTNIQANYCFHGILSYNIIYQNYINLLDNLKSIIKFNNEDLTFIDEKSNYILIKPNITINNNNIEFELLDKLPIVFINNNDKVDFIYKELSSINKLSKFKKYSNIIDIIPNKATFLLNDKNTIEIFDLYDDLLSINTLNINNNIVLLSNYIYNLAYFLFNYYYEENIDIKYNYLYYYISLKSIIENINYIYHKYPEDVSKLLTYENSLYSLSINTLGNENHSNNYYYFIKNYYNLVYNNANLTILPPKNYLEKDHCIINKDFNKKKSNFYNENIIEIKDTNYKKELSKLL